MGRTNEGGMHFVYYSHNKALNHEFDLDTNIASRGKSKFVKKEDEYIIDRILKCQYIIHNFCSLKKKKCVKAEDRCTRCEQYKYYGLIPTKKMKKKIQKLKENNSG